MKRLAPEQPVPQAGSFEKGLYGVSEMLFEAFLGLIDAGILKREVDGVTLHLRAGKGGNGCVSVKREKFKPLAGPDGGNGGHGGDIILVADPQVTTLLSYHHSPHRSGGNGGFGNSRFATASVQAPEFAKPGQAGEEKNLRLSLKLMADVGLLGFPNAGKSTFVARVSAARPNRPIRVWMAPPPWLRQTSRRGWRSSTPPNTRAATASVS